jgi:SAM-dependent MidA family methyltransferase
MRDGEPRPWREAWQAALYGDHGFYLSGDGPSAHFRTASHAAPQTLAVAMARLAEQESCTQVLEIAAGRGELAAALAAHAEGLTVAALDLVPRPADLPEAVVWHRGRAPDHLPDLTSMAAEGPLLVMAWEWLDVVPCQVIEIDEDGVPRVVLVEAGTGREEYGPLPTVDDRAWLDEWWPLAQAEPGDRAEVGRTRDDAWTALVVALRTAGCTGALLTVDYDHDRTARPALGSLSGFRAGRQVPPRPDGSCDLTAHVALDAVRTAGEAAGATTVTLGRQRDALLALGVEPTASGSSELLDLGSLGGFGWLLQRF